MPRDIIFQFSSINDAALSKSMEFHTKKQHQERPKNGREYENEDITTMYNGLKLKSLELLLPFKNRKRCKIFV